MQTVKWTEGKCLRFVDERFWLVNERLFCIQALLVCSVGGNVCGCVWVAMCAAVYGWQCLQIKGFEPLRMMINQSINSNVPSVPSTLQELLEHLRKYGRCYLSEIGGDWLRIITVPKYGLKRNKRVHLCVTGRVSNHHLGYHLNSVVLCPESWSVIAIQPRAFYKPDRNFIANKDLSNYNVYAMLDGTVLTLYYWEGKWCLLSARGFDLSTLKKGGCNLTFAEMVWDVASRKYPEFVAVTGMRLEAGRLAFQNLRTDVCYSFGFRHSELHFFQDEEKMWQVQHTLLGSDGTYETVPRGALPHIPDQELLDFKFSSYTKVEENLEYALRDYIAARRAGTTPPINYGYILKSKTDTDDQSFLCVKSPLYRKIKEIIYRKNDDIMSNYALQLMGRAYTDPANRYLLRYLFPQHARYIDMFEALIKEIECSLFTNYEAHISERAYKVVVATLIEWGVSTETLDEGQRSAIREIYFKILDRKKILCRYE